MNPPSPRQLAKARTDIAAALHPCTCLHCLCGRDGCTGPDGYDLWLADAVMPVVARLAGAA